MFKKLFSILAALTLSVGLWAETVNYLCPVYNDPQDVTKGIQKWETKTADATEITNSSDTLAAGWYVVKGYVETGTLTCQGAVHIILADDAKLIVTGDSKKAGIQVAGEGNSLTIYAQSTGDQMGQLRATGGEEAAGIGGGKGGDSSNITINGGVVTATGGKGAASIGGGSGADGSYITINGGTITAIRNDGFGAGIGGGGGEDGSYITISGGTVTATGGAGSAGIGGGAGGYGSYITISGGTVTATGGEEAAGIGGGGGGDGSSNITISGGTVTATGGKEAAGIGGGSKGSCYDITISGGTVTATGGSNGAGIGGGLWHDGFNITISGGTVTATGGEEAAGIGSGKGGDGSSNITISGGTVTANGGENAAGIGNGRDCDEYSSDIFVATTLVVKADGNNPPTTVIENDGNDLASDLAGKQYVTVENGSTPTALPETEDSRFKIQNSKLIQNGQLLIRKDGKMYNMLGVEVR